MQRHIHLAVFFFMVAINFWLPSEAPLAGSSKWKSIKRFFGFGKKEKGPGEVTQPATPETPGLTQKMLNKELLTLQSKPGKNPLQKLMSFVKKNNVKYVATKLPGLPEDLGGIKRIEADTWEDAMKLAETEDPSEVLLIDNDLGNKNEATKNHSPALWARGGEWEEIDIKDLFA